MKKLDKIEVPGTGEFAEKWDSVCSQDDGLLSVTLFDGDIGGASVLYEVHSEICECSYCKDNVDKDRGVWVPLNEHHHGWHVFFWTQNKCRHYLRTALPDYLLFQYHPSAYGFEVGENWIPDWKDIVRELRESDRLPVHGRNNGCASSGSYRKLWEKEHGPWTPERSFLKKFVIGPTNEQPDTSAETVLIQEREQYWEETMPQLAKKHNITVGKLRAILDDFDHAKCHCPMELDKEKA